MNKNKVLVALCTTLVLALMLHTNLAQTFAVKCEDIKYEGDDALKWTGEGHDDNNPSEGKFFKALEEKTFCEVNKDIDHMKIKGEIKEDTKHDWEYFKTTMYYQSTDEESQHKLWKAYSESPDSSGDKNLADYEMVKTIY
jgi:hypothetical protein